ncbi:hypothetical protein [Nocardiopsis aegyptia]|uniref:Uncharacterized protein n=1 Tax=Nocardiopsis aegyptia TaxID=220378 RepID=A0A7Z0EPJ7_9ACTN|nr:hypothetical protein [Nocardiopsis aegyptia]NYJ35894.1 hypothetical protein [Nocardiopsis aegyptia]
MFDRIGSLADRLLTRVVPGTRASASYCWWDYAPISSPCIRRYCCNPPGSGSTYCTSFRPC